MDDIVNLQPASPKSIVHNRHWIVPILAAFIVGGIFAYMFDQIIKMNVQLTALSGNLASTTAVLHSVTDALAKNISDLHVETSGISRTLSSTANDVTSAQNSIIAVKDQVGGVEQTVGSISGSVSTLQKLATTDPELLKKYSKVYFLNENYTPAHLVTIPQGVVYSNSKPELFLEEAMPFLKNLLTAASSSRVMMYVSSGYRSFGTQEKLKSEYTVKYGEGTANSFSADQGYSEHQLGTTVDFITGGFHGELTNAFDTTDAFKWLAENAYKYGFELSYPKGNEYYVYEPWHWRFVGVKLATYIHDNTKNFYDMDQRDIDTHLADFFDGSSLVVQ